MYKVFEARSTKKTNIYKGKKVSFRACLSTTKTNNDSRQQQIHGTFELSKWNVQWRPYSIEQENAKLEALIDVHAHSHIHMI